MNRILSKNKWIPVGWILVSTVIIWFVWFHPILATIRTSALFYLRNFTDTEPLMVLRDGGIDIKSESPYSIIVKDDVKIIIDAANDSALLRDSAPRSALITPDTIYYKKDDYSIQPIPLKDIQVSHPIELTPLVIRTYFNRYYTLGFIIIGLVGCLILTFFNAAVVLLGAGGAIVIDAFSVGKYEFTQLLSFSGLLYTLFIIVLSFTHPSVSNLYHFWHIGVVLFLSVMIVLTVLLTRHVTLTRE